MKRKELQEDHCLAIVDDATLFLAGGTGSSNEAYLYTEDAGWVDIGRLTGEGTRNFISCGVVRDDDGHPLKVVAAGSDSSADSGYEVDIYDLDTGTWKFSGKTKKLAILRVQFCLLSSRKRSSGTN